MASGGEATAPRRRADLSLVFEMLQRARRLVELSGAANPPVDIGKLAALREIREIRLDALPVAGELRRLKTGGYIVTLNQNLSAERRRFTLAHEVAHTFFIKSHGSSGPGSEEGYACDNRETEDLCNLIAAELLIPDHMLRRESPHHLSIESLLHVARTFECSLEAAAWNTLNRGFARGVLCVWTVTREGSEVLLKLSASPRTLGLRLPWTVGMKVSSSDCNWKALVAGDNGAIVLAAPDLDLEYEAERARLNRSTVVTLIQIGRKGRRRGRIERRQRSLFDDESAD